MIRLDAVSKVYQTPAGVAVHALRGVTLEVTAGEFVAVMGPSGSGKSTLMNLIGCLDRPTDGQYELEGRPVGELTASELARVRNAMVGFVFQNFRLLPRLTALENVELSLMYAGVPPRQRRERALESLGRVGVAHRASHRPPELSGGEQQRVAIARAVVNRPKIVVADEPTGALDSRNGAEVLGLFQALHDEGITMLVVTHDPDVARHARRLVVLRDGMLHSDEPIDEPLRAADRLAQMGGRPA